MNLNQENYKNLTPFKFWTLTNFPFIEQSFDSLTNYELMCKLGEYLNNLEYNQNAVQTNMTNLYSYVSEYFKNLEITDEIETILDKLASDGTLYNLINNELLSNINNQIVQNADNIGTLNQEITNTVKTTDSNVITMDMLNQSVRESLTGGSTAVVGTNSVDTDNIVNKAVTIYKIDDLLANNFCKSYENINLGSPVDGHFKYVNNSNVIVDDTNTDFKYYDVTLENNTIYQFGGFNNYSANGIIVYDSNNGEVIAYTPIITPSARYDNTNLVFKTNRPGLKAYINTSRYNGTTIGFEKIYNSFLTKLTDVNINKSISNIANIVGYLPDLREPLGGINTVKMSIYGDGTTKVYKLSKGTKYKIQGSNVYNYCGAVLLNEKMQVEYISSTGNVGGTPSPFTYEFTATNDGYLYLMVWTNGTASITPSVNVVTEESKYKSKKWTLIGDSLTDANVNADIKKYYSYVQDDLGLKIQNLGQSGCGYLRKFNNGNNFIEQSNLIDIDSDVVTIFGSFNDKNHYDNMGTITDTTSDTLLGAVNVTINNIIRNRPHTQIGIILPTPWAGTNPKNISTQAQIYLQGIIDIAKQNSIPVLNLFYNSNLHPGIESSRNLFFVNGDGVHPNSDGNKKIAYQIEEFIKSLI